MSVLEVTAPSRRRVGTNVGLALPLDRIEDVSWVAGLLTKAIVNTEPEIPVADYQWTMRP